MKRIRLLQWLGWSLLAMMVLLAGTVSPLAAGEIGKTVDRTNVAQYKDVLFPALYRAVERGDFVLTTAQLPFHYKHDPKFLAAGEINAGKFDVNAEGDLIDKRTGKPPKYNIYGYPFPHIDRNDPNIAVKIMWNFNYQKYRFMAYEVGTHIGWINNTGQHRWMEGLASYLNYQGRPPGHELKNPNNYLTMELLNVMAPMSSKGINTLTWDYFDEREITQFNYIPVFRRVRQASGQARSDPYQGTDSWLDNFNLWCGKNRSMKWKLVGERTILVPFTSLKKDTLVEDSDGSVKRQLVTLKYGFNTPGWKGAKWAPTSVTWVPRNVWIIEQMPKAPYYAWGLHINYVDKETNVIWAKEVNDKAGQFRTWVINMLHYGETSSGRNTVGDTDSILFIDEKVHHATIIDFLIQTGRESKIYMPAFQLGPDFFTQSNFLQISK